MSRSVSFHPAAEDELNEAAAFYDLESRVLAQPLSTASRRLLLTFHSFRKRPPDSRTGQTEAAYKVPVCGYLLASGNRDPDSRRCTPEATSFLLARPAMTVVPSGCACRLPSVTGCRVQRRHGRGASSRRKAAAKTVRCREYLRYENFVEACLQVVVPF